MYKLKGIGGVWLWILEWGDSFGRCKKSNMAICCRFQFQLIAYIERSN